MASNVEEEGNHTEKIPMTTESIDGRNSPSNADDMLPHKERPTPVEILRDFTQNTTFHGLRLIMKDHVGIVRRVLWFLLFLTCTVLMVIQISNRVLHYYSYPIDVNHNVNFDKMLPFPAVTVCNQNKFKVTSASKRNWYRYVKEMYTGYTIPAGDKSLDEYNASTLTLLDIYKGTAHLKEDFIVTCEWQNEVCGPENFTEVITDQGVCYSFNDNPDAILSTSSTGPGTGLKLTLNVEQYEYLPVAPKSAGAKLLLHDREQFFKVEDQGLIVASGTHAFVGIQLLKFTKLPAPHGTCESKRSPYYETYSPDACYLACMTQELIELCDCRHAYMPDDAGIPQVCTMETYFSRMKTAMVSASDNVKDKCKCPAPCDYLNYDPIISYGNTPKNVTDTLLAPALIGPLRKKYLQAREAAFRLDSTKFQQFAQLSNEVRSSFRDLQAIITKLVRLSLQSPKTTLTSIYDNMKFFYTKMKYFLEWQKFHVEKNFVAAKDEMEENIVSQLGFGYPEFSYQVATRIKQIAQSPWNLTISSEVKTAMYIEVMNMIYGRVDLAEKAQESCKKLYNAFRDGEAIFGFSFQDEPVEDNVYITPRLLLNESLVYIDFASNDSVSFEQEIDYMKSALLEYVSLAKKSYYDSDASPVELFALGQQFLERGRSFSQAKSEFYSEFVDYPLKKMQEKVNTFDERWKTFERNYKFITDRLDLLLNSTSRIQKGGFTVLDNNIAKTNMYVSLNNVTMTDMAEIFLSEQTQKVVSDAIGYFSELRSLGQDIYGGWSVFNQSTNGVWEMVLEDNDMVEFFSSRNMSDFLVSYAQVSFMVTRNYTRFRDTTLLAPALTSLDTSFFRSLDRLTVEMRAFIAGNVVDKEFIKNNFLQLDIYHKGKGYQELVQQSTYDVFALFCDIGGTMALFLGASVLTLCELLDLGLHHAIYRLTHNDNIH